MSEQLFDITFHGKISAGASLDSVKAQVGKMFNAEGAKLEQLFCGKRVVIKKAADVATASKYQAALRKVGAECTLEPVTSASPASASISAPASVATQTSAAAPAPSSPIPQADAPPQTAPLGISGDQIAELDATLAPPGAELQSEIKAVPEPQFDLSGLDLAPVGERLGDENKDPAPPPPDTSGLSLAD